MSSAASDEKVRIVCTSCGSRFKAPVAMAGKKGKCLKCGTLFIVPQPPPVVQTSTKSATDVDWSALSGAVAETVKQEDDILALAAEAPAAATGKSKKAAAAPTAAKGGLAGLRPEQREMLAARVQDKMKKDFQRFEEEEPAGSLGKAIAAGVFCALLGAGLWFGIFAGTGKELRYMAVVIGVLTGGGMYLGLQRRSSTAALAAAAIALSGIVAAKVAFVGWGEPFKVAALPHPKISQVEQQIDDMFRRPDPDETYAAAGAWTAKDYMHENNLTPRTMGTTEFERGRHEWKMVERRDALTADEGFDALYRWTYYSDNLPARQRKAELEWEAQQQMKAAEAAMSEDTASAQNAGDENASTDDAASGGEDLSQESDDEDVEEELGSEWSPQKKAAMAPILEAVEREFFVEVKAMPAEEVKLYWDEQREAERRARKIAAKRGGEEIAEQFVELGEDPAAAAAAAIEARKYRAFDVHDVIAIPLALAAAWFLGRGWN